ncbi:MAG: capsular polysaccharide export protein, LipB/KpsS family [Elusimicrobiota bacterium]
MKVLFCAAGCASPFIRDVIRLFLQEWDDRIERAYYLIGDKFYFDLLSREPPIPKLTLLYQHERFNPFLLRPVNPERLKHFEARYGIPHLWRYVVSERLLEGKTNEQKTSFLYAYLDYFDALQRELKPDVFVGGDIDCLTAWVANEVFKINDVVTLQIQASRLPGRVHIGDNAIEQLPFLQETYERFEKEGLSPQDEQRAREIVMGYRVRQQKPSYYVSLPRPRWFPRPQAFFKALWNHLKYRDEFFDQPFWRVVVQSALIRLRTVYHQSLNPFLSRVSWPEEEKYFYYPLSLEPETALLMIGWRNRDQLRLIRQIAEALPAGHKLYVKEHPGMLVGKRPLGFYRELARTPGVRLIDRGVDSYRLIPSAVGVVTVTGTVGLEAVASGKPVVLIGRAAYERCPGVIRVRDLEELPAALSSLRNGFVANERSLQNFLLAYEKRTSPGLWGIVVKHGVLDPRVADKDNVRRLADGISNEIRLRLERRLAGLGA